MKTLRIGSIGAGGRGGLAHQAHKPDEGSAVVAACDISPAALEGARAHYGEDIFTTSDHHELLKQDLDAVFITTPDFLHEAMAIDALNAGKAVYLEKPMAISTAGCDRILQAARDNNARLYLGHNMRHMPFVQTMKRLIDEGAIGNVKAVWCRHFVGTGGDYYFKDWHAEQKYSTSLLLQKGAHDIDVIHWLAGSPSRQVQAMGKLAVYGDVKERGEAQDGPRAIPHAQLIENPPMWPPTAQRNLNAKLDVEDISQMNMELENGALASYQQCHFTPDYWRNYCVIGDAGRLENFGDGADGTCIKVWNARRSDWGAPDEIHMINVATGGHGGGDPRIVEEFLRYVRDGGATTTSPIAARESVAAGCAAAQSLRNGGAVQTVAPPDDAVAKYFG